MFEKVITEQCHESWVLRGLFQISSLGPAAAGSHFCLGDHIELYCQGSIVKVPRGFKVRFWSHTDLTCFYSLSATWPLVQRPLYLALGLKNEGIQTYFMELL